MGARLRALALAVALAVVLMAVAAADWVGWLAWAAAAMADGAVIYVTMFAACYLDTLISPHFVNLDF